MKNIWVNASRFPVEQSKIIPKKGLIDENALNHYRDVCIELIDSGLTTAVTLRHFTNPIWFEELGGFEKEENIDHFIKFPEIVFNHLSDIVKYRCTINEPALYISQGYFYGVFPPRKKRPKTCWNCHQKFIVYSCKSFSSFKRTKKWWICSNKASQKHYSILPFKKVACPWLVF